MRRHTVTLSIVAFAFMIIYTAGCETKKDPFSAKNLAPQITAFFFRPDENPKVGEDSLKFKSNKSYRIHLEFNDAEFTNSETQTLEAVFTFINGSGAFSHKDLQPIGESGLRFTTPPTFNDDILFIPDTSGLIRIELTLTDGVKMTDPPARTAPTVFFLNLPPVPSFTASQDQDNPFRFRFDPEASHDRDGTIEKFIWVFGDTTTPDTMLTNDAVTHEYASAGKYSVVLKVIDNDGSLSASSPVEVTTPPVADLQVTPTQGTFPLVVVIDATRSHDPSGGELAYSIFIDNQLTYTDQNLVTHVFDTPRVSAYIIRLHVVSSRTGLEDDAVEAVHVKNTSPVANFTFFPTMPQATTDVQFDASASFDPDSTDFIANYLWSWGDTTPDTSGANLKAVTHEFQKDGNYAVKLTVTDRFGGVGTKIDTVRVSTQ